MRTTFTAIILVSLCFAGGWLIGTANLTTVKKAVVDSYINRYNAASGANADEVIYFVISDDQATLDNLASTSESIRQIEKSDYPRMFNVYLSNTNKQQSVTALRALDSVSAVFTVPFFCH